MESHLARGPRSEHRDRSTGTSDSNVGASSPQAGLALAVCVIAALVVTVAALFPPMHQHYAGGDAADYINNAFRRSYETTSAERFAPPAWGDVDWRLMGSAFTDGRYLNSDRDDRAQGLMTNYVRVFDGRVDIAHDDLTARVAAAALDLGMGQRQVGYLNYLFLGCSAVALFGICRSLRLNILSALLAGALLVVIPSQIMGARYLLSEALAQALWLGMVWWVLRTRAKQAAAFLPLVLLVMARPEFAVVAIAFAFWVGWVCWWHPVNLVTVVASGLLGSDISFLGPLRGPTAMAGAVLVGVVAGRAAQPALRLITRSTVERALARPAAAPITSVAILVGIVAMELVRRRLDPGGAVGPIEYQMYSTLGLIRDAVGWPIVVLGVVGLVWHSERIVVRSPLVLGLMVAPLLVVFASMHSSPPSIHFWTRRFHLVVFPAMLVGLALLHASVLEGRRRGRFALAALVAVVALSGLVSPLQRLDRDAFAWRYTRDFHEDVARLPSDAVVLLPRTSAGLKAQLPMRTVHGLYSFVVYDALAAREVLEQVDGRTEVLIDADLAAKVGLPVGGPSRVMRVRVSPEEGSSLELRTLCASPPCAGEAATSP